jgi:hypothetical protein
MRSTEDNIEALECRVLGALCTHPSGERYENCVAALGNHAWWDAEHRVIYEAVRRIGFLPPAARRRELPAEVTRLGFPDVDCSAYFEGESATPSELPELIRLLHAPRDRRAESR